MPPRLMTGFARRDYDVIVAGPALGLAEAQHVLIRNVLGLDMGVVLDADAITCLCRWGIAGGDFELRDDEGQPGGPVWSVWC